MSGFDNPLYTFGDGYHAYLPKIPRRLHTMVRKIVFALLLTVQFVAFAGVAPSYSPPPCWPACPTSK